MEALVGSAVLDIKDLAGTICDLALEDLVDVACNLAGLDFGFVDGIWTAGDLK